MLGELRVRFVRAISAGAAEGNVRLFYLEAVRYLQPGAFAVRRKIHVIDPAAVVAIKMAMLLHVRAITRGRALEVHMADEPALDEGIEAIINRGHGDIRHPLFSADEYVFGRRMIPLLQQHIIDMLALRRKTKAARGQPLVKAVVNFGMVMRAHYS